jgi:hypothetical protein
MNLKAWLRPMSARWTSSPVGPNNVSNSCNTQFSRMNLIDYGCKMLCRLQGCQKLHVSTSYKIHELSTTLQRAEIFELYAQTWCEPFVPMVWWPPEIGAPVPVPADGPVAAVVVPAPTPGTPGPLWPRPFWPAPAPYEPP